VHRLKSSRGNANRSMGGGRRTEVQHLPSRCPLKIRERKRQREGRRVFKTIYRSAERMPCGWAGESDDFAATSLHRRKGEGGERGGGIKKGSISLQSRRVPRPLIAARNGQTDNAANFIQRFCRSRKKGQRGRKRKGKNAGEKSQKGKYNSGVFHASFSCNSA